MKTQTQAYVELQALSDDAVPAETAASIRGKAAEDHEGNYATQVYVVRKQIGAFKKLAAFKPEGVPDKFLKGIQAEAAKNHPEDFATQVYVVKKQADGWLELNR